MIILHAIKSYTLYDLYFREDANLVWFGCIPGENDPKAEKAGIIRLFKITGPEYRHVPDNEFDVWVYEKRRDNE